MRKKVLYLITKATWGGAQKYVFDLATHLPSERSEAVVVFGQTGALAEKLTQAGIRTLTLPSLGRDVALVSDTKSFFGLLRCIRAEKPNVVHLNSSKAAALGALAARLSSVPRIVFTVHGWPFREQRSAFSKALIWLISWVTALLSHTIICVSEYDLAQAKRMPLISKKAIRIYNGIYLDETFGSGDVIRSSFPAGVHIIGSIGELNKNKNHLSLIERAHNDTSLYVAIVGDGELRSMLEQKIREYGLSDRVKLFGFLPARDVLKGFDTFALPSLKEGLPYVLLEAKLAGLPIEANRVGGVGEILDAIDMSEFSLERMVQQTLAQY